MRQCLENWVAPLAAVALLVGGCGSPEEVASVRSRDVWDAAVRAARLSGFHIETADPDRGVITGSRAESEAGAASRLVIRFRETPSGYRPLPVIRTVVDPETPTAEPARAELRPETSRSRAAKSGEAHESNRQLGEERELLENIRREMGRGRGVAPARPEREEVPAP